jgi:hypothetical protein
MPPSLSLLIAQTSANAPRPGDWRFGWAGVGTVAAGALTVIVFAWLITRWLARRQRRINNSPWCLFKELAAAHHLSRGERQLLTRMAQHLRLEQPATLFIEPACWEADRLGPAWTPRLATIEKLRRRLFAVR